MPGGSQICWHLRRSRRGPRQRPYHEVNSNRGFSYVCASEMPQPALDAIASDGVSERPTDNEPNARPGAPHTNRLGNNIIRHVRCMDNQRGPTHSKTAPSRPPEVLRVVHSQ